MIDIDVCVVSNGKTGHDVVAAAGVEPQGGGTFALFEWRV
jgi:hypothetical protein